MQFYLLLHKCFNFQNEKCKFTVSIILAFMFLFSSKSEVSKISPWAFSPFNNSPIEKESKFHIAHCLSGKILHQNTYFVFMYLLFPFVL